MSTRQRTNVQSSDLPPKRQGKVVRHDVSKPLQNISLSRLVNLLVLFAVLFTAFYAYRIVQWKSEVGGWWNLALGKRPPQMNPHPNSNSGMGTSNPHSHSNANQDVVLESHIHAVASILGMQPTDLAFALSAAVHQHVAPKTISSISSSISSSASAAGSSATAADALFNGDDAKARDHLNSEGVVNKAGTVAKAVEAIVGLDEPIMAD